jgi:hypothetical protein
VVAVIGCLPVRAETDEAGPAAASATITFTTIKPACLSPALRSTKCGAKRCVQEALQIADSARVTFLPSAYLAAPPITPLCVWLRLRLPGLEAPLEIVEWQLCQALGIGALGADAFWRLSRSTGKAWQRHAAAANPSGSPDATMRLLTKPDINNQPA